MYNKTASRSAGPVLEIETKAALSENSWPEDYDPPYEIEECECSW
jgi:hypothetical protein